MLEFETRVNGALARHVYVVRQGGISPDGNFYKVVYYRPNENPELLRFQIFHKHSDGLEALTLLVFKEVAKLTRKS
ncbi:MAG: hypothetical protein KKB31_03810 [Nanoarchaeota archaeon]|nr:hypothetical protein [Nanoarchaeota archaeon]